MIYIGSWDQEKFEKKIVANVHKKSVIIRIYSDLIRI